jgi:DNA polymerase III sliding clamp (beta) subunit (PCNA family)
MNREKLTKILNAVKAGLADKDIVEHSTSFAFDNGAVMSYNDQVSVRAPIDLDITGTVVAAPLLSFLGRVTGDEVKVECTENELLLKCGRARAGIPLQEGVPEHVASMKIPKKGWQDLPKKFLDAVRLCLFTAGKDMSKEILTNLHLDEGHIESSDNYRITRARMGKGLDVKGLLLPATAAKHLPSFAPTEMAVGKSWVHFRNEDKAVLSCRLFAGEFPDVSPYLKAKGSVMEFPKELGNVLDRAGVFSVADFDNDRSVSIAVKKGKLSVRAEGPDGWFEEKVKAGDMEDLSFSIHPDFLADILKHSVKATVSESRIVFKDKGFTHSVNL